MTTTFVSNQCRSALIGLLCLTWSLDVAAQQSPREMWHAAIGNQYAGLADATAQLRDAATNYCEAPDETRRAALDADWLTAYRAWQRVRYVDFGPIEQDSRAWQLQFWPDRKNLIARKANVWLDAPEPPDAVAVAGDSVAIQGFPALEYLLHDEDGPSLEEPQACALTNAIASHLADTAAALSEDWQAFGEHYLSTESYTDTTLNSVAHALEILEDKRLAEPMGLRGKPRNGYLAEAWRSGLSLELIDASVAGMRESFLPGLARLLEEHDDTGRYDELEASFDKTLATLAELPPGLAPALEDEAEYRALQPLYLDTAILRQHFTTLLGELGVVAGFNSSDGD